MRDSSPKSLDERLSEAWGDTRPHPQLTKDDVVGRPFRGFPALLPALRQSRSSPIKTIVELGGELGGSTRFFLETFPDAFVITIDLWPENYRHIASKWPNIAKVAEADNYSYYNVFKSFNWEWKTRLLPLRSWSGPALVDIFSMNIKPDLFYLDGDHSYNGCYSDLTLCHNLFPEATISGDDWNYNPGMQHTKFMGRLFPVQEAVTHFSFFNGDMKIISKENSFFIENPLSKS